MGFSITHGWSLCRDRLYILITCPLSGRRQIPFPLFSPLLLLLIRSKKHISSYKTPKHRLSFHVQFVAGDIQRSCGFAVDFSKEVDNNKTLPNDIVQYFCKSEDLCNGSSRMAEISIMMILLPASLVLISFFSRL